MKAREDYARARGIYALKMPCGCAWDKWRAWYKRCALHPPGTSLGPLKKRKRRVKNEHQREAAIERLKKASGKPAKKRRRP